MATQYSGNLLVKVRQRPFADLLAGARPLTIQGYRVEPLFKAHHASPMFSATQPADHWLTATANGGSDVHPWDMAHRVARAAQYSIYVEPDLLQEAPAAPAAPAATAQQGFDQNWPPAALVSPGWHLAAGFTGFEQVRGTATGNGIRIAHLDTGYWPPQDSTPRHIRRDLGYNFYENNTNTTDPGTSGVLRNPGHGTATLAILSGNTVDLIYQGVQYNGDFGGAPDAEVVPVRIGPSVVHFYSSAMAQGMDYALGPTGDPANSNPANKCDVVTISHGGLPSESWADAVNNLYEAGIVIVAASGDNFSELPTHLTVYPSAFNRVVTAVGATYDKTPYVTSKIGELQGNWGPDDVMKKAIAAYTPNVAWMLFRTIDGFDMDGAGTSASTPQIAAACALRPAVWHCSAAPIRVTAAPLISATEFSTSRRCSIPVSPLRSGRKFRPTRCSPHRWTASRFRSCGCCSVLARPAAKRSECTKPKQRSSSAVPPTRNWSTAFTPLFEVPPCRAPGSPVCVDCLKPSRTFPTLSQRGCEQVACSWPFAQPPRPAGALPVLIRRIRSSSII